MNREEIAQRDAKIIARYLDGGTLQVIALEHAITAERARQIVRAAGFTVADRGRSAREREAKAAKCS